MRSITISRVIDAPPDVIESAIHDLEPFMQAAGFDEVAVEGDRFSIGKALGLLKISLTLRLLDDPDATLAYEQIDGIFEAMTTTYTLSDHPDGTEVQARTSFALDAPGGSILDATVIKHQRRKELTAQFDYLNDIVS